MSTSSGLIRLDNLFRLYGDEAGSARKYLLEYATSMYKDLFPEEGQPSNWENEDTLDLLAKVEDAAAALSVDTAAQRFRQSRILEVADTIVQEHYSLVKQNLDNLPPSLIALLIAWLVLLFAGNALFAPHHVTSLMVLLTSAGAASGAIFLMLELDTPNGGFVQLSSLPLQHAIDVMERHPISK